MTNLTPTTKKQPYTGDPNAKLTICVKKLRRHLARDLMPVFLPTPAPDGEEPTAGQPQGVTVFVCRHCNQDPVIHKETPTTAT